jgi:hypothetical protein
MNCWANGGRATPRGLGVLCERKGWEIMVQQFTRERRHLVRHLARFGVAAFAVAALGASGISGALAQEEGDMLGGDIVVTPNVAGATVPVPSDLGGPLGEDIDVPEVTPSVLAVEPAALDEETEVAVPEVVAAALEAVPAPVDLTAIFGEGFPFSVEDEAEGAIGGDISVGGVEGGTITMGDGGEGEITITGDADMTSS